MSKFFSLVTCALTVASAAYATDYQAAPLEGGTYKTLEKVIVRFDAPVEIASGGMNVVLNYNIVDGVPAETNCTDVTGKFTVAAEGNDLILTPSKTIEPGMKFGFSGKGKPTFTDPSLFTITIPAEKYLVNGVAGEELVLTYNVGTEGEDAIYEFPAPAEIPSFKTAPSVDGTYKSIEKFIVRFDSPVEVASGGMNAVLNYNIVDGVPAEANCTDVTGKFTVTADGNDLILTPAKTIEPGMKFGFSGKGKPTFTDPSLFTVTLPAGSYLLDGVEGPELVLSYNVGSEGVDAVYDFTATEDDGPFKTAPAVDGLYKSIEKFTVRFNGAVEIASGGINPVINYNIVDGVPAEANCTDVTGKFTVTAEGNDLILVPAKTIEPGMKFGFSGKGKPTFTDPSLFTITLPAEQYLVDGVPGEELILTYNVGSEGEDAEYGFGGGEEEGMSITPAADSHVEALPTVKINFGKGKVPAWVSSKITNGTVVWTSETLTTATGGEIYTNIGKSNTESVKTATYSVEDDSLVISLPEGGLAAGKYTFYLDGNKYTVNGGAGEELEFSIYVDAPAADKCKEFNPTIDPNPTAITKAFKTLTLTFNEGDEVVFVNPFKGGVRYSFESAEAAAALTNGNNWFGNDWTFGGCFAEGNKLQVQNSASSGISIPQGAENVWFHFDEGIFTVNGEFNKAFTVKYYVTTPDFFDYDAEPVSGSTVYSLDQLSLDFFDVDTEEQAIEVVEGAKAKVVRNGAVMENYEVMLGSYETFLQMMVVDAETQEEAAVTDPGHYQVVIPAGSFTIDGIGNAEITLNYEIAYRAAEFVAEPANDATVRGIYTLKLNFEDAEEVDATAVAKYLNVSGAKMDAAYVAEGNTLEIYLDTPLFASYDEENGTARWNGEQTVTIPEGFYTVDGVEGAEIKLTYTFDYNEPVPTFAFTVNPAEGVVEKLGGEEPITLDFYNATSRATISGGQMIEAQALLNGEPIENATVYAGMMFTGECYQMQISLLNDDYEEVELTEAGDYKFIIPADSFTSFGFSNEEITLTYTVVDLSEIFKFETENEDGANVMYLGQMFLSFVNAKTDGSLKVNEGATGYVNRNGERMEDMYILMESFFNEWTVTEDLNLLLSSNAEEMEEAYIMQPGHYELVIPAGSFTIYGKENEEIALHYNIAYANGEYTANPEDGAAVASLSSIVLTFEEDDEIEVVGTPDSVEVNDAAHAATFAAEANTLTITFGTAIESEEGNEATALVVTIPEESYSINGREGAAIVLNYSLDNAVSVAGIAAEGVKVTVYDAQGRVVLKNADAKELNSLKGLFIVNGKKQIRK